MRSKFVTIMGWITIIWAFFSAVFSVGEFLLARYLSSDPELVIQLGLALQTQTGKFIDAQGIPSMLEQQAITNGLLSLVALPSGIGLLRRKEWARKLTMIAIVVVTLMFAPTLLLAELPAPLSHGAGVVIFIFIALVHGDVVRRLMAPSVREEFRPSRS